MLLYSFCVAAWMTFPSGITWCWVDVVVIPWTTNAKKNIAPCHQDILSSTRCWQYTNYSTHYWICRLHHTCLPVFWRLMGDFNNILSYTLKQIVQGTTRKRRVLDKIFTNAAEWFQCPLILPPIGASDHNCVVLFSHERFSAKITSGYLRRLFVATILTAKPS